MTRLPPGAAWVALVADDDDDYRLLVANALRRAGFAVLEHANGKELVASYEALSPARPLIVSDIAMPECDGIAATTALRKDPHRAPILLMTGCGESTVREAEDAGADLVLSKPINLELLVRAALALIDELTAS
jgi:CheY-like chemotaxis protein